jgi:hypothetical protein
MASVRGRYLPFSAPRRVISDMLYISQGIPLVPGERTMQLAKVVEARNATLPRPSWLAMFVKAIGIVSAANPEIRRVYVRRPWQRLFQYDETIVTVVVERDCGGGETGLFLARIKSPEKLTIAEIDAQLRRYKEKPIEEINGFKSALRMAALPLFVRRALWSLIMNWMPRLRGKFLGTCGISLTAGMGAVALSLLTPWTMTMFYDAFEDDGSLKFRTMIDHRVLDGRLTCRLGRELEQTMCRVILKELQDMARSKLKNAADSAG